MHKAEAMEILRSALESYVNVDYSVLRERVGHSKTSIVTGESGTKYQLEIQFFWDDAPDGTIRVLGSIDDGGWRAFVPLADSILGEPPKTT